MKCIYYNKYPTTRSSSLKEIWKNNRFSLKIEKLRLASKLCSRFSWLAHSPSAVRNAKLSIPEKATAIFVLLILLTENAASARPTTNAFLMLIHHHVQMENFTTVQMSNAHLKNQSHIIHHHHQHLLRNRFQDHNAHSLQTAKLALPTFQTATADGVKLLASARTPTLQNAILQNSIMTTMLNAVQISHRQHQHHLFANQSTHHTAALYLAHGARNASRMKPCIAFGTSIPKNAPWATVWASSS